VIKLNKQHQKEIAKLRKIIEDNRVKEQKHIDKLAKSLNLDYYEKGNLWDYIYNDFSSLVELE
jgi:hypothetical protein